ncbi:MAG: RNA polymerase sigma factor [Phycisphaerae bacterium]
MSVSGAAGLTWDVGSVSDAEAAARLAREFDACAPSLYRFFAVRTGDAHRAEDLVQQVWVQARGRVAEAAPASMEAWLRVIARNLLRTEWRLKARRPEHLPVPDPEHATRLAEELVDGELPASELERRETRDQLLLAITALPAAEQELIVGQYFDNATQAELAARIGVSERAVEGRLYRARQALRAMLARLEEE